MVKIQFKNQSSGLERIVKKGFSWTVFFFGIFALLFRGQIKQALIFFLLSLLIIPGIVYWIYLCFKANTELMDDLTLKGYKGVDINGLNKV